MINNTFFIVAREKDQSKLSPHRTGSDSRLYGGWEFVDGIEIDNWDDAQGMLKEYRSAMPSHTVMIHAKRIQ